MTDIDDLVFTPDAMPLDATDGEGHLLGPARVPLTALLEPGDLMRFAESVAELAQTECSVLLHDPERARPVVPGGEVQFVRAPICQALSAVEADDGRGCLACTHSAAHQAMAEDSPITTDCLGGVGCLYACPILLHHRDTTFPKAAVVAAVHDIHHFHFADRLAQIMGCAVAKAQNLMCQTDRRCLDAGQLRRLRAIMDVQTQSFSRQIGDRYGELESLAVILDQKTKLERAYSELDDEFRAVGQVQRRLIPQQTPDIPGFTIASYYQTALRAGGDYYDFLPRSDGSWWILIADVSGHGPAAAVIMAMMQAALHTFPGDPSQPEMALQHANRYLCRNIATGHFVTAFFGVLDPAAGRLQYVAAGHNPPLLFKAGTQELGEVPVPHNMPLGILDDLELQRSELTLDEGDLLLLYTDGIVEAFSPAGEQFGTERLFETVTGSLSCGAARLCDAVVRDVRTFMEHEPPHDDQTLVAVQRA